MFDSIYCRSEYFKNSFFPHTLSEWNKLDGQIRSSESYLVFRKSLLNFIRPSPNAFYNVHNPTGLKFLTRLRLGLSHLNDHKFRHNFKDCINPLCSCSLELETTSHFFLRCHHYTAIRTTLMNDLKTIDENILSLSDNLLIHLLLFGDAKYDSYKNSIILNSSVNYILQLGRFFGQLF